MERVRLITAILTLMILGCAPARRPADPFSGMLADVQRMELDSNDGRRQVLESILTEAGVGFERQRFTMEPLPTYPRTEGTNIVVTLGSGETDIVVGAHYDAAWLRDGTLSRGAVDNAASSVILTRLAATLADAPLDHRLHVVFFDMEEVGLVGSRRFIEMHDHAIDAAVNLDVNGYGDHVFFGPTDPSGNGRLHRALRETCLVEDIPCQAFGQYPASDYISFERAGIPNVSISVLPSVETHQLWLFLHSEPQGVFAPGFLPRVFQMIHTPNDSSEHVEPAAMELAYRAVLGLVRNLDSAL